MEILRRKSCRALLLTPANEILLIRIENPEGQWKGWIVPGGGMNPQESEETALRRELFEELGLRDFTIAGKPWIRFHSFPWQGKMIQQHEVFFFVRLSRFEPAPTEMDAEMLEHKGFRWWGLEELENSGEQTAPRQLARHLRDLVENGLPARPIDVGT